MKTQEVSQEVIIREMDVHEILDYASKLDTKNKDFQKLMKKCMFCYKQLTGKNLLNELNQHA